MSVAEQESLEPLLEAFKALADETRLRLLGLVAERPYTGRELAEALGVTQPSVSHHIEKLRRAGLISELREGKERVYSLNREALAHLARQQLRQAVAEPESDEERVLRDFFDGERLRAIPAQRKKRVVILRELLRRFDPSRDYTEHEVNELLGRAHEDTATLRRELVMYGYMTRDRRIYRVAQTLPERGVNVAQETGSE